MRYRQYQRALKLASSNGYKIEVALNANYYSLQREYLKHFNRLTVTFDYANGKVIIEP